MRVRLACAQTQTNTGTKRAVAAGAAVLGERISLQGKKKWKKKRKKSMKGDGDLAL